MYTLPIKTPRKWYGDIQHHNIRLHPVRGWLAYDPKGLYGERLYDTANALCNPATAPERVMSEERLLQMSQVLADNMGVQVERLRAFLFAFACLSASWPDKPEGSDVQRWFLTVAQNAERYVDFSATENLPQINTNYRITILGNS